MTLTLPPLAKRVLIGFGILIGVLVLAIILFFVFFPKDLAIAEAERRIEEATDRELTISGPVELTFWPVLGFSAEQASLSNPEGFDASQPFLAANRIVFAVKVMPLLRGAIEVKQLILDGAAFNLVANEDGAANWTFPTEETAEDQTTLDDLRLDEMRLTDGTISFQGAQGEPMLLSDVDADLALESLDQPAHLNAAFDYRDQRVDVQSDIGLPRAVVEQGETPISATVRADPLSAEFGGAFNAATGALTGALEANGASARRLAAWMGSPMGEGGGFGAFRVAAQVVQQGQTTDLTEASISLDDIQAQGRLTLVTLDSGRLRITGALTTPNVDVNTYIPAPAQGAQAGGVEVNTAWSSEPLDLTGLRAIDADIALTIAALKFQQMSFSDVAMGLRIANGALDARLTRIGLYGGGGTARLIADGSGATPRVAVELNAENVQAEGLLTDAIGFDRISGRGRLSASLVGAGASQAAIMRSLDGRAAFNFNDGAFKGINLAQVARSIQAALAGTAVGPNAETDFAELAMTMTLSNGVAATQDLRLLNPFVRLDGQGLIDIGGQSIDMRIAPRAVNNAAGQGGDAGLQGLGIPFRVSGSWSRVSFAPALGDVVQNELRSRAQSILRDQPAGSPLAALGEALFGRQPAATETPPDGATTPATEPAAPPSETAQPAQQQPASPRDIFEGLLRRSQKQRTETPAEPPAEAPTEPAPATP
ncbi:asmA protein [alpha proteobacterium U9-1i]|nr:asmA protein [alpha proteobacterium U9-1i]